MLFLNEANITILLHLQKYFIIFALNDNNMLRIINKDAPFPEIYPIPERKEPTLEDKGYVRVNDELLRDNIDLIPQPGLQEAVLTCECNLIFMAGSATMGKGADYKSLISTHHGWVTMGSLVVGKEISDTEGGIQTVEQIYELGETDLFLVKMRDGSSCRCTREHLWKYKLTKQHYKAEWTVGTLEELIEIMNKKDNTQHVYIPLPDPVFYEQKEELPIHPYVLGAMLGDGGMGGSRPFVHIHCPDVEILDKFRELGYPTTTYNKCSHKIQDPNFVLKLKKLNLQGCLAATKFIPEIYKFASIESRTELLRGLMDTDGNVEKFHVLRYSTISLQLAKDIQELVWSLGGNCTINEKLPHYTYKGEKLQGRLSYYLNINLKNAANYVTLPKKKERCASQYRRGQTELSREIIAIEYIGKEKCRCIRVSNPNRLYITDNYIVTHNTFSGFMKALQGLGRPNFTARLISRRLQDSKKGGSIIRDAKLIYDGFAGCEFTAGEYPTASWDIWNSAIQLIHANFNTENPGEWEDYKDYCKKNQSSYIYWDELTEIRDFKAFSYMFSRNRDNSGYGPCTVASFNPEHEHWSTDWLKAAGYIGDDWYAIPEKYGKITYFVIQGDSIRDVVFGETREEVVRKAGIEVTAEEMSYGMTPERMVKSFTYLSGTAMSNKILVNATGGGSVSNLYNVGLTERKKIKDGYFGPSDKSELTVSRTMIENLWSNPQDPSDQMYATLDVSSGKGTIDDQTKEVRKVDRCALWIWKGLTAINLEMFDGNLMELVPWIEQKLLLYKVPKKNFAFDAVAIGYYLISFTEGIPIIGNSRPITEYDQAGNIIQLGSYFNLRTQLMSKMKALLETSQVSCIIDKHKLYPTGRRGQEKELIDIMLEESNIFVLERKNRKDYYRSKDEYISRYKSSPDVFDPFFYRAVFELDARPRKEAEVELVETDYAALYQDYE